MRSLLFALLLSISGPAWADPFDAGSTILQWGQAHYECRMGETYTGIRLTSEQSDYACGVRSETQKALLSNGYCFDRSEQEWNTCEATPRLSSVPTPPPRPAD